MLRWRSLLNVLPWYQRIRLVVLLSQALRRALVSILAQSVALLGYLSSTDYYQGHFNSSGRFLVQPLFSLLQLPMVFLMHRLDTWVQAPTALSESEYSADSMYFQ